MSYRMSVLSRRLERFAVGFSVITLACLLLGFFANASGKTQLMFLSAGLASVCFFATLVLWLAHGFAWAMVPEKTTEATKPARTARPSETLNRAETRKPEEPVQPQETIKAPDSLRPVEAMKPAETTKPREAMKPLEVTKPADADEMRPIDWAKSAEENEIPPEDSPNAVYTITGRRIL
jgi:hypothetical protein